MRIFILDGTWPTAKVMLKRNSNLQGLSRLSLAPERPSRFRIKQQPDRLCLSTIESVHQFLVEANRAGEERTAFGHDVLLHVLDELCRRQIEYASDPTRPGYRRKPYSRVEDRTPVKRWSTRNFFVP